MQLETNRLETFLNGFRLAKTAEGCSPNTLHDYNASFKHFARWCAQNEKAEPERLTQADIKAFIAGLRTQENRPGKHLSPKTIYNAYVALRSFYRWLSVETGAPNPMLGMPPPKVSAPVIEPLTKEQIESLLKACNGTRDARTKHRASFTMKRDTALRDRAIVLVLLDSGVRASELCSLTIKDVDINTG